MSWRQFTEFGTNRMQNSSAGVAKFGFYKRESFRSEVLLTLLCSQNISDESGFRFL